MNKNEKCYCACHDPKWIRGLEHETKCCKNMVGWMEKNKSASTLGKLSRAKRIKTLQEKGITESEYMGSIRRGKSVVKRK